jgi:hypothetical protein
MQRADRLTLCCIFLGIHYEFLCSDLCGNHVSKRPYGELGSVDRSTFLCCVSAESGFGPLSPGCGCESEKVDLIVTELKRRMRERGDTAQIQRAEQTLIRLDEVDAKLVRRVFSIASLIRSCDLESFLLTLYPSPVYCFTFLQDAIMKHLSIPDPMKMGDRYD